jgi:hypothetical protein
MMKEPMTTAEMTRAQLEEQLARYSSLIVEIERLIAEMKARKIEAVWVFGMPTIRNAWKYAKSMRLNLEKCRERLVDGDPLTKDTLPVRAKRSAGN